MQAVFPQKQKIIALLLSFVSLCANAQTFIVSDVTYPDTFSDRQKELTQEAIGTEVYLLFSDENVRMTVNFKKDENKSIILQKIGNNLYREQDKQDELDLELNTMFGYIRSCKLSIYEKKHSNSTTLWNATLFLKRK